MRQKAKKIFTIFMVLTILVSSHAFAYYEHICLITKQKTVSFEPKTCTGKSVLSEESKTPQLKRSSCCEQSFKLQKVDNAQQNHLFAPVFIVFDDVFQTPNFVFSTIVLKKQKSIVFVSSNSSPPRKKLFILNDQFLI
ncbi:hypothetical protein EGI26_17075 [Lacihabitans sp. CCS-44]|uniref:HYC_CC_PP family protein n=1 Tax=Lacihabitans sp. CCS-44 TaxID=2487331 RepID=UPI0020CD26D1|nr:hypothetical protein [Lacihabitans sp. CCS-44]MCP9756880.1 hypothetical protein [Lacihabitans sp. CCS-44]